MAWTAPMTFVANSVLTASQLNVYLRDNLQECAPAKSTTAGSYFVGTGANAITERVWDSFTILTNESTTSTSFANLATVGPTVTVTTGTRAIVIICGNLGNSVADAISAMGVTISGATTLAASDSDSMIFQASTTNDALQAAYYNVYNGLTPGSNTFTMKYRVSSGTGAFGRRRLVVLPY